MYEIIFTDKAEKQFSKLQKSLQERISKVLERTVAQPHRYFERLVGHPLYKLRVGDYRLIAEIEDNKLIILIIKVGHRKNVYE